MIGRREFIAGAAAAVATSNIVNRSARADTARVRRDVQSLSASDPFFAKYGAAVQKMHQLPASDPRNWRNQALIHINHCPHGATDFVHWHRHYILNFELICGTLIGDTSFALPYWNWSANNGTIPNPFYDLNLLNVTFWNDPSNAQSDNWGPDEVVTVGRRGLAKGTGLQSDPAAGPDFTQDAIDSIKSQSIFDIFTGQLEGMPHNNGHVITGRPNGHMIDGLSPLDPIFWLHHCNIDRIWAEWQTAGNTTPGLDLDYNNQFVNGASQPVTASSASALDFAAMGYTYDVLTPTVVAAAAQQLGLQTAQPQSTQSQPLLQEQNIKLTTQSLGADSTEQTAVVGTATSFAVAAPELLTNLFRPRTFRAANVPTVRRLAVGSGRIVARLSVMGPPADAAVICKVFVNHPDPTANTPTDDPHYAGSFSFFGARKAAHGHRRFYVDISKPLRAQATQGRLATDQVKVQLVPVVSDGQPAAQPSKFTVTNVELLAV